MGDLGVFEADANAGKLSAEAAAKQGFELQKSIDRAVFRAKERLGAYLANAQSKDDFNERFAEVKPQVIKIIAEVMTPTPGVIRRVGAALRPSLASSSTKRVRPSSAKTVKTATVYGGDAIGASPIPAMTQAQQAQPQRHSDPNAVAMAQQATPPVAQPVLRAPAPPVERGLRGALGSTQKTAWAYDQTTRLYTSNDPMQHFACPGCGTEQQELGFNKCAGCDRQWNSWAVRRSSSAKTGASTYMLMAREIKMRGDQFKLAAEGNVKTVAAVEKVADGPQEPPPGVSQPSVGTMPGDNSGAMGAPLPPAEPQQQQPSSDGDQDIAGQVTENSPIDHIQDALEDAIYALKDVQMLSINPALAATASSKAQKVATLRTAMDKFWGLHRELSYVAGQLAKEANEAIQTADPRITSEAQFTQGYYAAAQNLPLPDKTARAWLEGYVAFYRQAEVYGDDSAAVGGDFRPSDQDESNGARNEGTFLGSDGLDDAVDTLRNDAGPFDTSQPASREFASNMDADNAAGGRDRGQGESGSIQPTGSRKPLPKGRK